MKDKSTGLPLRVWSDATVGPYIRLQFSQLDEVRRILDSRSISYSVKEDVVSLSGGPFMAILYLGRGADAGFVQTVLDNVP
ncbi:MAG: hypothetical protein L0215_05835 [Gemmataceae bacterium]|nr:hypothetical protein [Gemmataceae bacterium]